MKPKKRDKPSGSMDITTFFSKEAEEEKRPRKPSIKPPVQGGGRQASMEHEGGAVANYVLSKGKVLKSELYSWCKAQGVTPAELYRELRELEAKGMLKKVFDGDAGEIAYIVVKE